MHGLNLKSWAVKTRVTVVSPVSFFEVSKLYIILPVLSVRFDINSLALTPRHKSKVPEWRLIHWSGVSNSYPSAPQQQNYVYLQNGTIFKSRVAPNLLQRSVQNLLELSEGGWPCWHLRFSPQASRTVKESSCDVLCGALLQHQGTQSGWVSEVSLKTWCPIFSPSYGH